MMDAPAIAQIKILDNKTSSPSKAIESALPVGKTVTAKITQVSPEQARQDSHRVKLEINKSLLQISAKFSGSVPEKGSTVSLQRSASGQIQLSLIASGDNAAKQTNSNPTSSSATAANTAAANDRTATQTPVAAQSNAQNAVKTTSSEQSSSATSAALAAKLAANNLSPLLANNIKTPSAQANPSSVTLKVPVTINASGAALNIIEQALPKGETLSARVVNQVLTNTSANNSAVANPNTAPATTRANSSAQISTASVLQTPGTANNQTTNQSTAPNNNPASATLASAASKPVISPGATTSSVNTAATIATPASTTATTNQALIPAQANPSAQTASQPQAPSAATQPGTLPATATVTGAKQSATSQATVANSATNAVSNSSINTVANSAINAVTNSATNQAAPATSSGPSSPLASSTGVSTVAASGPAAASVTASVGNNSLPPGPLTSPTATAVNTTVTGNSIQQGQATTSATVSVATHTAPNTAQSTATGPVSAPTNITGSSVASSTAVNSTLASTTAANPQPHASAANSPLLGAISRPVIQAPPSSGAPLQTSSLSTNPIATSTAPTAISSDKAAVSTTNTLANTSTTVAPQNQQLNNLQAQTTAIKISVAGQQVSLQGPANLPPLQNVQITRTNGPQANIQWQQPAQSAALAVAPQLSTRQAQVVEQSLRQVLPVQIPIAEGINQLVAQSVQIANSSASINAPVDKIALSIMQMFGVKPGAHTSSATIKRNVQHGGLFTESKLLNHSAGNQGDMKNFLSKLRQMAKQLPAEQKDMLLNTTDRMLARVTASQLTHVQQQHTKGEISNERTFQVDIPVQQNEKLDNVEMEIKQRKHRNEQGEFISVWSVKLHFDLAEHGEVDAEVALNPADNSISTTFLCTNLNTVRQIERAMPSFRQQLNQQGFEINTLHCTQGSQAAAAANNPINKRIIDIRT